MNTAEYILSGILEQYALGDVTPQEKKEVECMSHIYPEIKEALAQVQQNMEQFALEHATPAPAAVKTKLFARIEADEQNNSTAKPLEAQATSQQAIDTATVPSTAKVVNTNFAPYKWAVAASIAVAVGSAFSLVYNSNSYKKNLAAIQNKLDSNTQQQQQLIAANNNLLNNIALITSVDSKTYSLAGNDKVAKQNITVVWNKATGNVFITGIKFPPTAGNKQYQLWALDNGQPIDLGVFDANTGMLKMKDVTKAQAFAVTIEQKGGSPTPTLTELCGAVNI